jgi:hypothetical protein
MGRKKKPWQTKKQARKKRKKNRKQTNVSTKSTSTHSKQPQRKKKPKKTDMRIALLPLKQAYEEDEELFSRAGRLFRHVEQLQQSIGPREDHSLSDLLYPVNASSAGECGSNQTSADLLQEPEAEACKFILELCCIQGKTNSLTLYKSSNGTNLLSFLYRNLFILAFNACAKRWLISSLYLLSNMVRIPQLHGLMVKMLEDRDNYACTFLSYLAHFIRQFPHLLPRWDDAICATTNLLFIRLLELIPREYTLSTVMISRKHSFFYNLLGLQESFRQFALELNNIQMYLMLVKCFSCNKIWTKFPIMVTNLIAALTRASTDHRCSTLSIMSRAPEYGYCLDDNYNVIYLYHSAGSKPHWFISIRIDALGTKNKEIHNKKLIKKLNAAISSLRPEGHRYKVDYEVVCALWQELQGDQVCKEQIGEMMQIIYAERTYYQAAILLHLPLVPTICEAYHHDLYATINKSKAWATLHAIYQQYFTLLYRYFGCGELQDDISSVKANLEKGKYLYVDAAAKQGIPATYASWLDYFSGSISQIQCIAALYACKSLFGCYNHNVKWSLDSTKDELKALLTRFALETRNLRVLSPPKNRGREETQDGALTQIAACTFIPGAQNDFLFIYYNIPALCCELLYSPNLQTAVHDIDAELKKNRIDYRSTLVSKTDSPIPKTDSPYFYATLMYSYLFRSHEQTKLLSSFAHCFDLMLYDTKEVAKGGLAALQQLIDYYTSIIDPPKDSLIGPTIELFTDLALTEESHPINNSCPYLLRLMVETGFQPSSNFLAWCHNIYKDIKYALPTSLLYNLANLDLCSEEMRKYFIETSKLPLQIPTYHDPFIGRGISSFQDLIECQAVNKTPNCRQKKELWLYLSAIHKADLDICTLLADKKNRIHKGCLVINVEKYNTGLTEIALPIDQRMIGFLVAKGQDLALTLILGAIDIDKIVDTDNLEFKIPRFSLEEEQPDFCAKKPQRHMLFYKTDGIEERFYPARGVLRSLTAAIMEPGKPLHVDESKKRFAKSLLEALYKVNPKCFLAIIDKLPLNFLHLEPIFAWNKKILSCSTDEKIRAEIAAQFSSMSGNEFYEPVRAKLRTIASDEAKQMIEFLTDQDNVMLASLALLQAELRLYSIPKASKVKKVAVVTEYIPKNHHKKRKDTCKPLSKAIISNSIEKIFSAKDEPSKENPKVILKTKLAEMELSLDDLKLVFDEKIDSEPTLEHVARIIERAATIKKSLLRYNSCVKQAKQQLSEILTSSDLAETDFKQLLFENIAHSPKFEKFRLKSYREICYNLMQESEQRLLMELINQHKFPSVKKTGHRAHKIAVSALSIALYDACFSPNRQVLAYAATVTMDIIEKQPELLFEVDPVYNMIPLSYLCSAYARPHLHLKRVVFAAAIALIKKDHRLIKLSVAPPHHHTFAHHLALAGKKEMLDEILDIFIEQELRGTLSIHGTLFECAIRGGDFHLAAHLVAKLDGIYQQGLWHSFTIDFLDIDKVIVLLRRYPTVATIPSAKTGYNFLQRMFLCGKIAELHKLWELLSDLRPAITDSLYLEYLSSNILHHLFSKPFSAAQNHENIVKFALERGVSLFAEDENEVTPFHIATYHQEWLTTCCTLCLEAHSWGIDKLIDDYIYPILLRVLISNNQCAQLEKLLKTYYNKDLIRQQRSFEDGSKKSLLEFAVEQKNWTAGTLLLGKSATTCGQFKTPKNRTEKTPPQPERLDGLKP